MKGRRRIRLPVGLRQCATCPRKVGYLQQSLVIIGRKVVTVCDVCRHKPESVLLAAMVERASQGNTDSNTNP